MDTPPFRRSRWLYAGLSAATLFLGLLLRSHLLPFGHEFKKYGGDSLWALLVFLLFATGLPRMTPLQLGLLALAFAWSIEFSQLYHSPWLDQIRANRIGHLVLGSTFNSPDLIAYLFGITLAVATELLTQRSIPKI